MHIASAMVIRSGSHTRGRDYHLKLRHLPWSQIINHNDRFTYHYKLLRLRITSGEEYSVLWHHSFSYCYHGTYSDVTPSATVTMALTFTSLLQLQLPWHIPWRHSFSYGYHGTYCDVTPSATVTMAHTVTSLLQLLLPWHLPLRHSFSYGYYGTYLYKLLRLMITSREEHSVLWHHSFSYKVFQHQATVARICVLLCNNYIQIEVQLLQWWNQIMTSCHKLCMTYNYFFHLTILYQNFHCIEFMQELFWLKQ